MKKVAYLFILLFSFSVQSQLFGPTGAFFHNYANNVVNCPTNFVFVPGNSSLGTSDFCVAKYEMKNDGSGNAVSQPSGDPWNNISPNDSFAKCAAMQETGFNNGKFALISNPQWMTIARNIELVSSNWSSGTVGTGNLVRGWSASTAGSVLPDPFSNTTIAPSTGASCLYNADANTCGTSGIHRLRRTHQLSNGSEIWDFSGNRSEWVDWDGSDLVFTLGPTDATGSSYPLTTLVGDVTADDLQSLGGYTNSQAAGMWSIGPTGGVAYRGAAFFTGQGAGIYYMNLKDFSSPATTHSNITFRCVWEPPSPAPINCPTGFVGVPGNSTLGTDGFCVMKYEAKNDGSGNAVSQTSGDPWNNISPNDSYAKCAAMQETGFNNGEFALISNPEWMTIARNIEQVSSNWSSGTVGTGNLVRGWSANTAGTFGDPFSNTTIAPSTGPSCLYNVAADTCGTTGLHRLRRTFHLSNGQEVWDFAGNYSEWVDWIGEDTAFTTGPTVDPVAWYPLTTLAGSVTADDLQSLGGYDISQAAGNWSIGPSGVACRGGMRNHGQAAGVYYMSLNAVASPTTPHSNITFRCVWRPTPLVYLGVTTPTDGAYINASDNIASYAVSGTCSEEGVDVVISGDVSATTTCSSGNFSTTLNLTAVSDGAVSLIFDHSSATTVTLNLTKDTVLPGLTQTTISSGINTTADNVTFGGACEDGLNVNITGTDTTSVACAGSTWSYTTANQTSDGNYNYTFSQTDSAGNTASIAQSWVRDTVAPVLTSFSIADGSVNVGTLFTTVKAVVLDANTVTHIRTSNANNVTGNCQSEYADDLWEVYTDAFTNHSVELYPGDGTKRICVWAKDAAGNISAITANAGIGISGIDMDEVQYEIGNVPVITAFTVVNTSNGSRTYAVNDPVTISWSVTDVEGLDNNPVSIYYTTDNISWTPIITDYGSLSGNPTSYNDSYTSFTAPSAAYFILKLMVRDTSGNTSYTAYSNSQNTGNWSIYAGNVDNGVDTSATVARLWQYGDGVLMPAAIDPNTNDAYLISEGEGIYKLTAKTGIVTKWLGYDPVTTLSASGGTITPTLGIDTKLSALAFGRDGYLYLNTETEGSTGRGTVFKIDVTDNSYTKYMGGGTEQTTGANPAAANIFAISFTFDEDNTLYYFAKCNPTSSWSSSSSADADLRLMKLTQNPDGSAGNITHVAGNCSGFATPTYAGSDPKTQPLLTQYHYRLLSVAAWDSGNKIVVASYGGAAYLKKIINGALYKSNYIGHGIFYHHKNQKLYSMIYGLQELTLNTLGDDGDTKVEIVSDSGTDNDCRADGKPIANACIKGTYPALEGPGKTLAFLDNAKNNASTPYIVRYASSLGTLETYVGSLPFYGDGKNKLFMRGDITGIYYKKATESNLTAFPEGLYFQERTGPVFGYINDTTGMVTNLWGTQDERTWITNNVSISSSLSMGPTYYSNGRPLTFDTDGLPWMRADHAVVNITSGNLTNIKTAQSTPSSAYVDKRNTGDSVSGTNMYPYGGVNNFTMKGTEGLFVLQGYQVSSPAIKYLNFTTDQVLHVMGDINQTAASSADDATGGNVGSKTIHGTCASQGNRCFLNYRASEDRLYFSENNALRYITTPTNPATSTLGTLFTTSSQLTNYIFSLDGSMVFYIKTDLRLRCHNISSGNAWCDDSDLGPTTGLAEIMWGSNQFTWKDSTTLLISNYQGLVYEFKLP